MIQFSILTHHTLLGNLRFEEYIYIWEQLKPSKIIMKYIYVLVFVQLFLLFGACQSNEKNNEVKAKPLYINYEVRYLEQEKELRALAYFKEGDSLKSAVSREFSNATFQSSAMEKQNLGGRGSRYILTRKGAFSSNLDFGYKNDEGIPINYDLSMPAVGKFFIKGGNIYKNKGTTIVWKGDPLDASQSIVFMFTDKNNKASSASIKGPTKLPEAFISTKNLAGINLGKGQLYLIKKQVRKTTDQNQTILSVVEYYTSPIDVEFVE
jgi:hypothetical protein